MSGDKCPDCGVAPGQPHDHGLRFTTTAQPPSEGEVTVGADGRVRFRGLVTRDPVPRIKPIAIQAGEFTDGTPYLIVEVEGKTMALGNDVR